MQAKRKEHNSLWRRHLANNGTKDIEENQRLSNSDQINSVKLMPLPWNLLINRIIYLYSCSFAVTYFLRITVSTLFISLH